MDYLLRGKACDRHTALNPILPSKHSKTATLDDFNTTTLDDFNTTTLYDCNTPTLYDCNTLRLQHYNTLRPTPHGCAATQTSPSSKTSFFQIGTVSLSVSIANSQASKAAFRWGVDTAMITAVSPTAKLPTRWCILT